MEVIWAFNRGCKLYAKPGKKREVDEDCNDLERVAMRKFGMNQNGQGQRRAECDLRRDALAWKRICSVFSRIGLSMCETTAYHGGGKGLLSATVWQVQTRRFYSMADN
jgi:hypothetical protein